MFITFTQDDGRAVLIRKDKIAAVQTVGVSSLVHLNSGTILVRESVDVIAEFIGVKVDTPAVLQARRLREVFPLVVQGAKQVLTEARTEASELDMTFGEYLEAGHEMQRELVDELVAEYDLDDPWREPEQEEAEVCQARIDLASWERALASVVP